jgi:DMSO/TMAO reductase YedYZ molybdopterin-dependent catalytic subunit
MAEPVKRRAFILGAISASSLTSAGYTYQDMEPTFGTIFKAGDVASFYAQQLILAGQSIAREYGRADITKGFPVMGTAMPKTVEYKQLLERKFLDWRLPVTGLVDNPTSFSLSQLAAMPARTQITAHSCEDGWTAIAEWTGVQLSYVLSLVGLKTNARYVFLSCADGWWGSLHLFDALHLQTLLAYSMNGEALPVPHGAPIRLRVERQLGYKSLKYVTGIQVCESLGEVGNGSGAKGVAYGFSWNGGI